MTALSIFVCAFSECALPNRSFASSVHRPAVERMLKTAAMPGSVRVSRRLSSLAVSPRVIPNNACRSRVISPRAPPVMWKCIEAPWRVIMLPMLPGSGKEEIRSLRRAAGPSPKEAGSAIFMFGRPSPGLKVARGPPICPDRVKPSLAGLLPRFR